MARTPEEIMESARKDAAREIAINKAKDSAEAAARAAFDLIDLDAPDAGAKLMMVEMARQNLLAAIEAI